MEAGYGDAFKTDHISKFRPDLHTHEVPCHPSLSPQSSGTGRRLSEGRSSAQAAWVPHPGYGASAAGVSNQAASTNLSCHSLPQMRPVPPSFSLSPAPSSDPPHSLLWSSSFSFPVLPSENHICSMTLALARLASHFSVPTPATLVP